MSSSLLIDAVPEHSLCLLCDCDLYILIDCDYQVPQKTAVNTDFEFFTCFLRIFAFVVAHRCIIETKGSHGIRRPPHRTTEILL